MLYGEKYFQHINIGQDSKIKDSKASSIYSIFERSALIKYYFH